MKIKTFPLEFLFLLISLPLIFLASTGVVFAAVQLTCNNCAGLTGCQLQFRLGYCFSYGSCYNCAGKTCMAKTYSCRKYLCNNNKECSECLELADASIIGSNLCYSVQRSGNQSFCGTCNLEDKLIPTIIKPNSKISPFPTRILEPKISPTPTGSPLKQCSWTPPPSCTRTRTQEINCSQHSPVRVFEKTSEACTTGTGSPGLIYLRSSCRCVSTGEVYINSQNLTCGAKNYTTPITIDYEFRTRICLRDDGNPGDTLNLSSCVGSLKNCQSCCSNYRCCLLVEPQPKKLKIFTLVSIRTTLFNLLNKASGKISSLIKRYFFK